MVSKTVILFLFGAAIASGQFMRRLRPVLTPMKLPKFPIPVKIEKPFPAPVPIVEPCEPAVISEMDVAGVAVAAELPPQEILAFPIQHETWLTEEVQSEMGYRPMVVPQPLELPPFVMPEPMVAAPWPEEEQINIFQGYVQQLAPLPAATVLPPARLHEIPVHIEVSSQPIMPPMNFLPPPMIFEEPCITGEPSIVLQPPRLPEPVKVINSVPMPILSAYPEPALIADPCDSPLSVMEIGELPPYFVRHFPEYNLPHVIPNMVEHHRTKALVEYPSIIDSYPILK